MSEALGDNIELYTPAGYSHMPFKGLNAGCPDHIFTSKKIEVITQPYNWDFVKEDAKEYPEQEFTKKIKNPYPDHAMIKATLHI